MADSVKTLGKNLNRLRLEKGMDKQTLSARLGISEKDLEEIESGTQDGGASLIFKIIEILHVKPEDLLASDSSRNQLLQQIKSRLDTCPDHNLMSISKYMDMALRNKRKK